MMYADIARCGGICVLCFSQDCINADLFYSTADALLAGGFAAAGYTGVHIDDCWAAKERDPITKQMVPDPARFPGANVGVECGVTV